MMINDVYNSSDDLDGPDCVEADDKSVEQIWARFAHLFDTDGVSIVKVDACPVIRLLRNDDEEEATPYDPKEDGWRYLHTSIHKNGGIWMEWYQKHSSESLEVRVRLESEVAL